MFSVFSDKGNETNHREEISFKVRECEKEDIPSASKGERIEVSANEKCKIVETSVPLEQNKRYGLCLNSKEGETLSETPGAFLESCVLMVRKRSEKEMKRPIDIPKEKQA